MALTRILSLNPTLNPKPRSFSVRRPLPSVHLQPRSLQLSARASSSDSDVGRVIEFEQADPAIEATTGGGYGSGDIVSDGGNGGGGGSGGEEEGEGNKKGGGMLMSQKITLGYAAFILAGGVMGYVKSGSQKSALAGLISALLLGVVYKLLPIFPTLASMLGFAMSGALTQTMFSRFRQSGKVFPAGIVCVVSFIMLVGYGHGIFRSH
ncbi:hypothetical protein LUZ60_002624 [Juncus effusus]|nr:hypothetical protein LUZ60_002624 [Juncus effusus]